MKIKFNAGQEVVFKSPKARQGVFHVSGNVLDAMGKVYVALAEGGCVPQSMLIKLDNSI